MSEYLQNRAEDYFRNEFISVKSVVDAATDFMAAIGRLAKGYEKLQMFEKYLLDSELKAECKRLNQLLQFVQTIRLKGGKKAFLIFKSPEKWEYNFDLLNGFYTEIKETRLREPFEDYCIEKSEGIKRLQKKLYQLFGTEKEKLPADKLTPQAFKIKWRGSKASLIQFAGALFDTGLIEMNEGNRDWQLIESLFQDFSASNANSKYEGLAKEKQGELIRRALEEIAQKLKVNNG